jgi:hypothetical protein
MPETVINRPMHIHPHLRLYVGRQQYAVPAEIGIKPSMWRDHHLDKYIGDMGAAPIHTHDSSGILHVESSVTRRFTFGEFLDIWGIGGALKNYDVNVSSNGQRVPDYRNLALKDGQDIVLTVN